MALKDIGAMLLLAALWGASFLFMRIAAPVIGPLFTIEGRFIVAGFSLLLFMWIMKRSADFKKWWKQYLLIGAINAAIPFTLIATSLIYLSASMGSILNSLTPLFTALVAWGWLKEKLTIRKWLGILIGIVGVVILVGWSPLPLTKEVLLSTVFILLSGISYGFAGVYAKVTFKGVPALALTTGQQIGAMIVLIPFTLIFLPYSNTTSSPIVILSVIGLGILCTAVAYLIYFYLIENVGPMKTLSVTFLVPFFGMIWGAIFLNEQITMNMIIGLAVILGGMFLIVKKGA